MGLPKFEISFETSAINAIGLASRGFVAIAIKDSKQPTGFTKVYKNFAEVVESDFDATNYAMIGDVFKGTPTKVKVVSTIVANSFTDIKDLILQNTPDVDYFVAPSFDKDNTAIVSWIDSMRSKNGAKIKGVLAATGLDKEYIVQDSIKGAKDLDGKAIAFTAPRVAGILAGLDPTRSSTYFVIPEYSEITAIIDPDASIDAGNLIAINDGSKIKIARGVNSFTSTTPKKGEIFTKIKNVETMDMISYTIRQVVADEYVGKFTNSLDNKNLIVTAVNQFLRKLADNDFLNPSYQNRCFLDLQAHIDYAELNGVDTTDFTETEIKKIDTGDNIYLIIDCKLLDTIEDVQIKVYI